MSETDRQADDVLRHIRRPLLLTRLGMVAEAAVRAFWPLWSVLFVAVALLMLGVQDSVAVEWVWGVGAALGLSAVVALVSGIRRFRWPSRIDAMARMDAAMPGRPIQTALDSQAIGKADEASRAVWTVHQARMRTRLETATAVQPDLRVSRADPFALRYLALLLLSVGLLFGSVWKIGSVTAMTPGGASLAAGPSWEGWVEPPVYTRMPSLYLNDIAPGELTVPEGSRVMLRFYGEVGALRLAEGISGAPLEQAANAQTAHDLVVVQSGALTVEGPGGRTWDVLMRPDAAPQVALNGDIEASARGEMSLPFSAADDHGIARGQARIELAMDQLDRRYGLTEAPEPRETIVVELPMPISGDRVEFDEILIENFSQHPWANMPVTVTLTVEDASGQSSAPAAGDITLMGRRFFEPLAAAVIEGRRDLLWSRSNATRVAQIMRAVSYRPDDVFRSSVTFLRFRTILRRLEAFTRFGQLSAGERDEIAQAMWDLAVLLEDGDLGDALERLRRAQERLSEAMRNGASDQEIAELMQELRDATDDYMRQLSRQAQEQGEDGDRQAQQQGEQLQMSQNDLQRMMDRIQELMEQGRMAEAQQALEELRQMMENMRVTQGPGGQGQPSPGQQAMEGLAETLREQQGLTDQAFRDLQDQFNPGQQGQQPGQQGQGGQLGEGNDLSQSLADRQGALRRELERQRGNLPGAGTEPGDVAREALGRADRAMDGAEQALRSEDLAEAIDRQAEAMNALRDGMRSLSEAMAQEQQNQGQQGMADGQQPGDRQDPLGRNAGTNGQIGSEDSMLQGEDVYRRARELLDEIRRRTGDGERPDAEIEYLERLLERF